MLSLASISKSFIFQRCVVCDKWDERRCAATVMISTLHDGNSSDCLLPHGLVLISSEILWATAWSVNLYVENVCRCSTVIVLNLLIATTIVWHHINVTLDVSPPFLKTKLKSSLVYHSASMLDTYIDTNIRCATRCYMLPVTPLFD